MSLYACDYDGSWNLRERVSRSDGTIKCCESGILIPDGQPYAEIETSWSDDHCVAEMDWAEIHSLRLADNHSQCIEVWRLLRRNNRIHGACAYFGGALELYKDAADDAYGEGYGPHKARYAQLVSVIRRAKARYNNGGGPRLHKSELASLLSGEWADQLPWEKR